MWRYLKNHYLLGGLIVLTLLIAFWAVRWTFLTSDSAPASAPAQSAMTAPVASAASPAQVCGVDNPMPEWTSIPLASSDTDPADLKPIKVPPPVTANCIISAFADPAARGTYDWWCQNYAGTWHTPDEDDHCAMYKAVRFRSKGDATSLPVRIGQGH